MLDKTGRRIEYLRLSITERCTLKCTYCRSDEGACPKRAELSADDFVRIGRACAALGMNKIRITGGEPLLRHDVEEIISRLAAIDGISEIAMTTNAIHLPGRARALKEAGLARLNISLDSLQPARYAQMTGGGDLACVLAGIADSLACGLLPLKLNAVLMRGVNDDEIDDFINLAKQHPLDVRFIELMPMGDNSDIKKRIPTDEILAARPWLKPLPPRHPGQPSADYGAEGFVGRVGFISPISHQFCGECNRIRIMSDGMLRPCLGKNSELSLLNALADVDDTTLLETIRTAVYEKPSGHAFHQEGFTPDKTMSRIGG
ncbi:GTP 3',8-cyclase MoaA [Eubacteriales bacterium OttesenSCG-928-K08]|nr:GTP 3',8-cyclase MoaA [Eubacteriales bacterium OttesenSCG-928-K08]